MIAAVRRRLAGAQSEAGLTLIEMLVAMTMSVVIVGASTAMLISAVHDQPALSRKAQNVTTARWQLERIVREFRNGVKVETATASEVSFLASVRRAACGGEVLADPTAEAIKCRITFRCTATSCTRTESSPDGLVSGATTTALSGVGNPESLFCFVPSSEPDPVECGPPQAEKDPTYIGVQLEVPNPEGPGLLTISDGATLRTATLSS
ncbi:MAG TPA: type II secretion system protein [Solirubrobacterales bacterium]|nr:type II secretion system protein [Solirubrobacterales bacterium]